MDSVDYDNGNLGSFMKEEILRDEDRSNLLAGIQALTNLNVKDSVKNGCAMRFWSLLVNYEKWNDVFKFGLHVVGEEDMFGQSMKDWKAEMEYMHYDWGPENDNMKARCETYNKWLVERTLVEAVEKVDVSEP